MPINNEPPGGSNPGEPLERVPYTGKYDQDVVLIKELLRADGITPAKLEAKIRSGSETENLYGVKRGPLENFEEYTGSVVGMTNAEDLLAGFGIDPTQYNEAAKPSTNPTSGSTEMYLKRYGGDSPHNFIKVLFVKGDQWRTVIMFGSVNQSDGSITAEMYASKGYQDESIMNSGSAVPYEITNQPNGDTIVHGVISGIVPDKWNELLFADPMQGLDPQQLRQSVGALVRDGVVASAPRTINSASLLADFATPNRAA